MIKYRDTERVIAHREMNNMRTNKKSKTKYLNDFKSVEARVIGFSRVGLLIKLLNPSESKKSRSVFRRHVIIKIPAMNKSSTMPTRFMNFSSTESRKLSLRSYGL